MERIQCEVSESPGTLEDVRAAVARCREQGAQLELVGIVRTSMFDAPQPAHGERVRRFNEVQHALVRAIRIARSAGITPSVFVRAGKPTRKLARQADAPEQSQASLDACTGKSGPLSRVRRRSGRAGGSDVG
jgi:hypothetical protein